MNMEQPLACVSVCVTHAVIQFLMAKNKSTVEIHRQLTEVYGNEVTSIQMVRKWFREFCKGRCEVHDKSHTGRSKVVMDELVNTIREKTQRTIAKKFKTVLSANKVMCTGFWDVKGVMEYFLKGTTINVERYCEMLKNLCKVVKRKRLGLLMEGVILLQDNVRPHSANVT